MKREASHPASLRTIGHLMPHVADSKLFEISGAHYRERDSLAEALRHSHLSVWLGYTKIPADMVPQCARRARGQPGYSPPMPRRPRIRPVT